VAATGVTATGAYRASIPAPYGTSPISGAPFAPIVVTPTAQAAAIDAYIRSQNPTSPLIGQGAAIVAAARRHNVDPAIIVALAGAETNYGSAANTGTDVTAGHNAWGLGPHIKYPTWDAGIEAAAATLANLGAGGASLETVLKKWNATWTPAYQSGIERTIGALGGHINPGQPAGQENVQGQPISTGWGADVVGIFGGVIGQLGSVLGFLGGLLDPHNFLRLGEDVVGVLGLAGAVFALVKGKPMAGLALGMGGYLFLYAGVKDVSPVAQVRDAFQPASARRAGAASTSSTAAPASAPPSATAATPPRP
jgi:Mannosyl-glycoprotein endo-beta-N-acetylglucosaminidase